MDTLKNRLLFGNMIGLFVLAYALMAGPGLAAPGAAPALAPLGTSFTYEGRLGILSGRYDIKFRLFDAATGGTLVSPIERTFNNLLVDSGEYVVALAFGNAPFTGDARFLEVKYRPHSTDPAAPYTTLGSRPAILPAAYALSLRPGAVVTGDVPQPGRAVVRADNTGTGVGLWGSATSNAGVYGLATTTGIGVWGKSIANAAVYGESTNSTGVSGLGAVAGVLGRSANGTGVSGKSTSANGVYGETAAGTAAVAGVYGKSTGAGSIGIIGETTGSGNSWGIYGIGQAGAGVVGKASSGVGVSGISTLGYAMESFGHATQRLNSGGWVKAMARIRIDGVVEQCFNSQLAGVVAAFSPCGITVTHTTEGTYILDFGFQIDNRFVSVTPFVAGGNTMVANLGYHPLEPTHIYVFISWSWRDPADFEERADAPFNIIVY